MQRYSGQALLKFDDVTTGNTTGVVGVTVRDHETQDLAVLYSDNGITGKSNPFNTDSDGTFSFYAANGVYDVIIEQGTAQESRQDDVILFDPRDGSVTAMTAADFFALAEKRRRDAAGSGEEHGVPFSAYTFPALNPDEFELAQFAKIVDGVRVSTDAVSNIYAPPAPDGLDKADGTGRFAGLAAAIAAGGTELSASVINRQDFCFLEVWHEKVSDKDIVVQLGNVQYGATEWKGISLVGLDTLGVGQGYSAFGEWDTTTQGNGVRWSTLSEADKAKFVADPENNIYLSEGGELIQVRYRIRVVAGLEGDWIREGAHYISTGGQYVAEQGDSDVPAGLIGLRAFNAVDADKGLLQSASGYQVPICLVSRHNQGAFYPSYNSRGTKYLAGALEGERKMWYDTAGAVVPTSAADCFGVSMTTNENNGGFIGSTYRPEGAPRNDGEFYDAIYAKYVQDSRKSSLVRPVDEIREEYKRKAIAAQSNFTPTMWENGPFTTSAGVNSLSGARVAEHTFTDVVSTSARLATVFPDGVYAWFTEQDGGTHKLERKALSLVGSAQWTVDGTTWNTETLSLNSVLNTVSLTAGRLYLIHYTTPAHITEGRVNAEKLVNGKPTATSKHEFDKGNILCSSLIGKVQTSDTGKTTQSEISGLGIDLIENGLMVTDTDHHITHDVISLSAPDNGGPAVKTLDYLTHNNGVLDLQYAYKEMIYDVTWGDNNQFEITDNQSTLTDDNGNTVLYGTAGFETAYFYLDKSAS